MKYVVDCSVAFKWVVAETDTPRAVRLREDYRNGVHELLAPDLFPSEVSNALIMAERKGRIAPGDATRLLLDVLGTAPVFHAAWPDLLPRAHEIAVGSASTVYDCLYVALAEREGCELVTADTRLIKDLGPAFPFIIELSSLP